MTNVRDIMRPARWTTRPDDTLGRAAQIMAHGRRHQLLVVDAGALAGVISERDVLDRRVVAKSGEDWWHMPVRSVMQGIPITAGPDDPVADAIDRLARSPVDVLPIVENGFVVGEITATELFQAERISAEPPPGPVTAAEAMTEPAVWIGPTDSLLDAARLMVDHQIRHLPVVDNGEVIGMLSDRDIRTIAGDPVRYLESRQDNGARMLNVRDAMARAPLTVRGDRPLTEVANQLADERVGALPVVDAEGKLIGIVSYVDALRALAP